MHAVDDLQRLLGVSTLNGKIFCDIGCGNGLHAVVAVKMGVEVTAININPISAATTFLQAEKFKVNHMLTVGSDSIFAHSLPLHRFDIFYSWGVLHYTGAMWRALDEAIKLVSLSSESIFAVVLYRKTSLCFFGDSRRSFISRHLDLFRRLFESFGNVNGRISPTEIQESTQIQT